MDGGSSISCLAQWGDEQLLLEEVIWIRISDCNYALVDGLYTVCHTESVLQSVALG